MQRAKGKWCRMSLRHNGLQEAENRKDLSYRPTVMTASVVLDLVHGSFAKQDAYMAPIG